jgi:hypothetical protein
MWATAAEMAEVLLVVAPDREQAGILAMVAMPQVVLEPAIQDQVVAVAVAAGVLTRQTVNSSLAVAAVWAFWVKELMAAGAMGAMALPTVVVAEVGERQVGIGLLRQAVGLTVAVLVLLQFWGWEVLALSASSGPAQPVNSHRQTQGTYK